MSYAPPGIAVLNFGDDTNGATPLRNPVLYGTGWNVTGVVSAPTAETIGSGSLGSLQTIDTDSALVVTFLEIDLFLLAPLPGGATTKIGTYLKLGTNASGPVTIPPHEPSGLNLAPLIDPTDAGCIFSSSAGAGVLPSGLTLTGTPSGLTGIVLDSTLIGTWLMVLTVAANPPS